MCGTVIHCREKRLCVELSSNGGREGSVCNCLIFPHPCSTVSQLNIQAACILVVFFVPSFTVAENLYAIQVLEGSGRLVSTNVLSVLECRLSQKRHTTKIIALKPEMEGGGEVGGNKGQ